VIVGGGPAGHAAAASYRKCGGTEPVTLLSADRERPYNRPPLSKGFLRGDTSEQELPLESADFYTSKDIEVRLGTPVVALHPSRHELSLETGDIVSYGSCVLATGSHPGNLSVPGSDHLDIHRLRTLADARELRTAASAAGSAVIIGSGFIGCEAAVSLARRGLDISLVTNEAVPQEGRLGSHAGGQISDWLASEGVEQTLGATVTAIQDGHHVLIEDRPAIKADLVLMAVGATPNARLAQDAGLDMRNGRVRTDSAMRTNVPDILAAGDLAFAHNAAAGRPLRVQHWGEALRMGEISGATAAGKSDSWAQAPGFWTTIGDRTLKYVAWGDGFDEVEVISHHTGGFEVWYGQNGICVGALTFEADEAYVHARDLIESHAPLSEH
jgi:NADPH-dependent 2,4-dienoyl-CoA reductase/sulfur reductase-like enzyme